MKVFLYYNTHYDESNLIDVQEFMQNTLEKLLDNQKFKTQSTIKILRSPSETDFFCSDFCVNFLCYLFGVFGHICFLFTT